MKLQKMNNKQFFITLPNAIVRAKGWEKGDLLEPQIDKQGRLVLVKKQVSQS